MNLSPGLPTFAVVGLPEGAVREGRERVTAALLNAGRSSPLRRVVVNLAPADVRKDCSAFDLPIALGLLAVSGQLDPDSLDDWAFVGELGLDGCLRPVRGVASIAEACLSAGLSGLVVPMGNAPEAAAVGGLDVVGAPSLVALLAHLDGGPALSRVRVDATALLARPSSAGGASGADLADVCGQVGARRALEVAAAGGHNLLLVITWRPKIRVGDTRDLPASVADSDHCPQIAHEGSECGDCGRGEGASQRSSGARLWPLGGLRGS